MPTATALAIIDPPQTPATFSLCRQNGLTCAACCWGRHASRRLLTTRLSRNRDLFSRHSQSPRPPSATALFIHELWSRCGSDLVYALLLHLPFLRRHLQRWLADRVVCAFAAFESDDATAVGCLLHPSRYKGVDVRAIAAFRLLPGFSCGPPSFSCKASKNLAEVPVQKRADAIATCGARDWFDYSTRVREMSCDEEESLCQ